ncbi:MAG: TonB-dependent receptor, partial [Methylomicrobium sp.]|nr:TonB-dependent receptor [Methylomicrobium sp.]
MTAAVLVAVNANAAKVDDRPPKLELPSIEIIGQGSQLEHIPGSGSIVDKTVIERQGPLSSKDALRTVPGINIIDEDVLGRRFNLGIRGLDPRRGVRTQVLEDGAPIQLAPYSDPSNQYIPSMLRIDRIEVLKGSGQLIYGPQTIGGAINYVSPAIPEEFSGSIRGAGGNNGYYDAHVNLGGTIDNVGLALDYIRQEADGNRQSQKQLLDDLAVRSLIKFNDRHRLLLKGTYTYEEARMGEAGMKRDDFINNPRTNFLVNDVFEVERYSGQALYEFDVSDDARFSTNIYGHYMSRESIRQASDSESMPNCNLSSAQRRDFRNAPLCGNEQRPRNYGVFGIEPRFVFNHDIFGVNSETAVGVRGHFEWVERKRFVGNAGPTDRTRGLIDLRGRDRHQDNSIDTQSFSFFAQNKFFLGDFTVTPGVRVEYFNMENTNNKNGLKANQDYAEALPGIGATYNGFDNITLFAGVHRGFAPPRPDETLSPTTGTLNVVDPETSLNYEVGIRTQPTPGINAEITWFRIDIDDQI